METLRDHMIVYARVCLFVYSVYMYACTERERERERENFYLSTQLSEEESTRRRWPHMLRLHVLRVLSEVARSRRKLWFVRACHKGEIQPDKQTYTHSHTYIRGVSVYERERERERRGCERKWMGGWEYVISFCMRCSNAYIHTRMHTYIHNPPCLCACM